MKRRPSKSREHDRAPVGGPRRAHLQHLDRLGPNDERLVAHVPDEVDVRGRRSPLCENVHVVHGSTRRPGRRRHCGDARRRRPARAQPPPARPGATAGRAAGEQEREQQRAREQRAPRVLRQVVDGRAEHERRAREQAGGERPRARERDPREHGQPGEQRDQHRGAQLRELVRGERQHDLDPGRGRVARARPPGRRAAQPADGQLAGGQPGRGERGAARARAARGAGPRAARRAPASSPAAAIAASLGVESAGQLQVARVQQPERRRRARTAAPRQARSRYGARTGSSATGSRSGRRSSCTRAPAASQRGQRLGVARQTRGRSSTGRSRRRRAAVALTAPTTVGGAGRDDLDALGGQARRSARRRDARRSAVRAPATAGRRLRSLALGRLAVAAGDDQPHAPRLGVRLRRRARSAAASASSKLESGALPTSAEARASRTTASSIAGGVVELLDHQAAAMRRRGPVHAAQRLAGLVLAHAVQLVPAAAAAAAARGRPRGRCRASRSGSSSGAASTVSDVLPRVASTRRARPKGSSRTSSAGAELAHAALERAELVAPAQHAQTAGRDRPQRARRTAARLAERAAPLRAPSSGRSSTCDAHPLARVGEGRQRAQRDVRPAGQADPDAREQRPRPRAPRRAARPPASRRAARRPARRDRRPSSGAPARGQRSRARAPFTAARAPARAARRRPRRRPPALRPRAAAGGRARRARAP